MADKNHFGFNQFTDKTAPFVKIGLNNFLDSEFEEIIDLNAQTVKNFNANTDEIAEYIDAHKDYEIVIATKYQERVKEILACYDIFDVE